MIRPWLAQKNRNGRKYIDQKEIFEDQLMISGVNGISEIMRDQE